MSFAAAAKHLNDADRYETYSLKFSDVTEYSASFQVLNDGSPEIGGFVKWDGCINWDNDCLDVMLHECTLAGLEKQLGMVRIAYQRCLQLIGAKRGGT